ncbi:MAG: Rne/Rng family ribonuclease [Rickettsiales bacterium]
MSKRLLIDASHAEQVRVVVLDNGKVVEYDGSTNHKQQIRGNIYLAKITRIEPSLQAAFIEYGGKRHGFLPFSEIHPDYYKIPVADKQKLLESVCAGASAHDSGAADLADALTEESEFGESPPQKEEREADEENEGGDETDDDAAVRRSTDDDSDDEVTDEEDPEEEAKRLQFYKRYKIQDVIKPGQILLVQAEKEERGNKGASLTTFISLAGKYCVLMPNSLKKGGVSRKIAGHEHRRKLRDIVASLNIPREAGVIVRTAGAGKEKNQILADYDYLAGLWNTIRQATLSSEAPAFIHAEEDVVRRAIRDLYDDAFDEALVEGRTAYESARQFISTIMPEHKSRVRFYENKTPLFNRFRVEEQINALFDQTAPLDSGGSIVINPTEALVSIDVNSGKATAQRDVEETALATNLEAAKEIARQMKLRDLSGLIVIDFIDMMDFRNRKAIEKALKDAFADDRARIQIGRISNFGLLEMSRQRLRPSLWEMNTSTCSLCKGTGAVKSSGAIAVQILRAIDHECARSDPRALKITMHPDVAVYIFNHKRDRISRIEENYGVKLLISPTSSEQFAKNKFEIKRVTYSEEGEAPSSATERLVAERGEREAQAEESAAQRQQSTNRVRRHESDEEEPREDERGDHRGKRIRNRRPEEERRPSFQGGDRGDRREEKRGGGGRTAPAVNANDRPTGFTHVLEGIWRRLIG